MRRLLALLGLGAFAALGLAAGFASSGLASEAGRADAEPHKVFVCKYVGQPDVDERLQTGNNPISVAASAIPAFVKGMDLEGLVGQYFADAQGRSFVLAVDRGQAEPDASACPGGEPPPITTETTPTETTPTETTPTESTPTESTPTDSMPTDSMPTESTPTESMPTESTPTESTPTDSTPTETTPTESTPAETTPDAVPTTPATTPPARVPTSPPPTRGSRPATSRVAGATKTLPAPRPTVRVKGAHKEAPPGLAYTP